MLFINFTNKIISNELYNLDQLMSFFKIWLWKIYFKKIRNILLCIHINLGVFDSYIFNLSQTAPTLGTLFDSYLDLKFYKLGESYVNLYLRNFLNTFEINILFI